MPDPKNPARELYELMKLWSITPAGFTVLQHRSGETDWWTSHVHAMELLQQLQEQVDSIKAADPDDEAPIGEGTLRRIKQAVLAVDSRMSEMNSASNTTHLKEDDLATLHLLAALWKTKAPANPGAVADVLDSAREIEDLIIDLDEDIDDVARDYLLALVHNLQAAVVSINVKGTVDVEHLTDQLAGALARLFPPTADEEKREKAKWTLERLVTNVKLMLGLVSPTVQAIDSAQSLFTNQPALPAAQ